MEIDHLGIACVNIHKAKFLYEQLGFVETKKLIVDPDRNLEYIFMRNGVHQIELISSHDKSKKSDVDGILSETKTLGNKIYHVCYLTKDMKADINKYVTLGYKLIKPPSKAIACENREVAFLLHFELGVIELLVHP